MRRIIRFGVSSIDNYHYFMGSEEKSLLSYVMELCKIKPDSKPALLGSCFHQAIEKALRISMAAGSDIVEEFGVTHYNDKKGNALSVKFAMPDKVDISVLPPDEGKTEYYLPKKYIKVDGSTTAALVARIDSKSYRTLIDYKSSEKSIDLENFFDAFQWRGYMHMDQDAEHFRYDCFKLGKVGDYVDENGDEFPSYNIREHKHLTINRYDGLDDYVIEKVKEYVEFLLTIEEAGWIKLVEAYANSGIYKVSAGDRTKKTLGIA